jgi:hypothetical protein
MSALAVLVGIVLGLWLNWRIDRWYYGVRGRRRVGQRAHRFRGTGFGWRP